jgi:anti-sigma-K factor RskA/putative zinc finger protein
MTERNADVHALIGAYVLDAVDDLERAAFDRHLRDCPACRSEVDELREASARLAGDAWSVPPPALRGNVLAAIAATRQISPAPAAPARRPPARLRLLAAAAAVVVAAGGAGYAVQEWRVRAEHSRVESLENLLSAPDLTVHDEPVTGGGTVTVAASRSRDAAVITLAAATAPGDGRVYQLWTIRARKPVPAGTLAAGQKTTRQIVRGLGDATDVGVSIEPPGGSTTPTMPLAATVHL